MLACLLSDLLSSRLRNTATSLCFGGALCVAACESSAPPRPVVYYPNAYPAGTNPPSQPYATQPYPAQTNPNAVPPAANPPSTPVGAPAAPVLGDPISTTDLRFLRTQAQNLLNELVAGLPAAQQQRVNGIPLVVDSTVGEVNAFATCTTGGRAAMAITDGLLDIEAHMSQARANDETFGTRKLDEYIRFVAQNQRPKQPIVQPPLGFFDPGQQADGRKVARQHQLLDEQIGFVLGHELAHHYLGHLPCTGGGGLSPAEIGRVLSDAVPLFNQPNEVAADVSGTNNLLTIGMRRQGYHLTEGGAMLTMQFFGSLDQLSPADLLFGFDRTHPPPQLRAPIIQQTAAAFRATGGRLPFSL